MPYIVSLLGSVYNVSTITILCAVYYSMLYNCWLTHVQSTKKLQIEASLMPMQNFLFFFLVEEMNKKLQTTTK